MSHMFSPDEFSPLDRAAVAVPASPDRPVRGQSPSRATGADRGRTGIAAFLLFASGSIIMSALAVTLGQYY